MVGLSSVVRYRQKDQCSLRSTVWRTEEESKQATRDRARGWIWHGGRLQYRLLHACRARPLTLYMTLYLSAFIFQCTQITTVQKVRTDVGARERGAGTKLHALSSVTGSHCTDLCSSHYSLHYKYSMQTTSHKALLLQPPRPCYAAAYTTSRLAASFTCHKFHPHWQSLPSEFGEREIRSVALSQEQISCKSYRPSVIC